MNKEVNKKLYFCILIFIGLIATTTISLSCSQSSLRKIMAFLVPFFGYSLVMKVTEYSHIKAETEEYPIAKPYRKKLKIFAGLLEFLLYTALFLFRQITLLAGLLVIKGIWYYPPEEGSDTQDGKKDSVQKSKAAGAIYRIGVFLSVIVSFITAMVIKNSEVFPQELYQFVLSLLE